MKRDIAFGKPIIGDAEKQAVGSVMDSGLLVHGPRLKEFEAAFARFTSAPRAVGVANCTAAMHSAYLALRVGPGDEVIVPAQTHTATAHAVELVGARPIFVDAEGDTGNIDIDRVARAITAKTKAISIVHFLGRPVDMERLCEMADQYRLYVIEDCALALGARIGGKHVGLFGTVGCFSFYPVKHITTAEGGMLITADQKLADTIAHVRAFGVDRHHGIRPIPGFYDVTALGFNYRMSEIHAALGIEQMKRLPAMLAVRKQNYEALSADLQTVAGIEMLQSSDGPCESSYYCLSILLSEKLAGQRDAIVGALKQNGVGTSIYYPQPVPRMTYYRNKYGYDLERYPQAARISDRSIALPVGPHLDVEDMAYIAENVRTVVEAYQ